MQATDKIMYKLLKNYWVAVCFMYISISIKLQLKKNVT